MTIVEGRLGLLASAALLGACWLDLDGLADDGAATGGGATSSSTTTTGMPSTSSASSTTSGEAGSGGAGGSPALELEVQYRVGPADTATDALILPHFRLTNNSDQSVALEDVTIRYWYERDGITGEQFFCDFAAAPLDCGQVAGTLVDTAAPGANRYIELSFVTTEQLPSSGGSTGEIQTRINAPMGTFDETDDHSYDGTKTTFALWDHVTAYHRGVLVWGIEP